MPDKDVNSIRDLIYYQYAKIIAKRAFAVSSGKETKKEHYGFIKKTFLELKNGTKSWSDISREDWQLVDSEKMCIYCGSKNELQKEHLVPRSLQIKPGCNTCDTIQGIHNQIWACKKCNSLKGTKGLYEFFKTLYPEKKFYDLIPSLAEKKYLKTIYNCHECTQTLDKGDIDGDNKISVMDIDYILHWPSYKK
jgi:5-methylcytosine-specific restriction endonuclease McrA